MGHLLFAVGFIIPLAFVTYIVIKIQQFTVIGFKNLGDDKYELEIKTNLHKIFDRFNKTKIVRGSTNRTQCFLYPTGEPCSFAESMNYKSMAKGQIIIHIYASNLREIVLPLPEKEEQTVIVQFIETEISLINTKAEKAKKLIELLKEYKTSLISEVVTGKIRVIKENAL